MFSFFLFFLNFRSGDYIYNPMTLNCNNFCYSSITTLMLAFALIEQCYGSPCHELKLLKNK